MRRTCTIYLPYLSLVVNNHYRSQPRREWKFDGYLHGKPAINAEYNEHGSLGYTSILLNAQVKLNEKRNTHELHKTAPNSTQLGYSHKYERSKMKKENE